MLYNKGTAIPPYIYGIICELATMGYIDENQAINADFLNKVHIEELIDLDEIGKEVKRRLGGLKMDLDEMELKATKNREKTGDEMFKELGYEKIRDIKTEVIYRFDKRLMGDRCIHNIMFAKVSKLVFSYGEDIEKNCGFGIKELQAINKKCEELGWK